jgi:hypothetical protein
VRRSLRNVLVMRHGAVSKLSHGERVHQLPRFREQINQVVRMLEGHRESCFGITVSLTGQFVRIPGVTVNENRVLPVPRDPLDLNVSSWCGHAS